MKTQNNNSTAFVEKEPSLFIVQTPFQAMCAISTIRQLKIDDYSLSLHFQQTNERRNRQTIELIRRYGLKYSVTEAKSVKRIDLLYKHKGMYNRVFLGTHLYHDGYYYALKETRKGGNIVLLDDGVATISLLKEGFKVSGRSSVYMAWYKTLAFTRNIKINNLFTVYKDILNPEWNIAFNNISKLRSFDRPTIIKDIYIIGTNNGGYIDNYGVSEDNFRLSIHNCLKKVRNDYPHEKIVYIPHGRDKTVFAKDYCREFEIEYMPLELNVENYILSLDIIPRAVFGFTSSALYNLKVIFPESEIYNIVLGVLLDKVPSINGISQYYEEQGIKTLPF